MKSTVHNKNVIVYVLDAGINAHENFGSRVIVNITSVTWKNNSSPYDSFGHGTHVAGTVAGEYSGVAKNVFLASVKVADPIGAWSDIIAGIQYVIEDESAGGISNLYVIGGLC